MTEELEKCENCLKMIPTSKMTPHFGYCRRNVKKCPTCHQMYDINNLEDHEEEFHKKEVCQYCKKQIPKDQFKKHTNTCFKKPKLCQYCQQSIPNEEYTSHFKICESRTKVCQKCHKSVVNSAYLVHLTTCRELEEQLQPPSKNYNQRNQKDIYMPTYNKYQEISKKEITKEVKDQGIKRIEKPSNPSKQYANIQNDKRVPKYHEVIDLEKQHDKRREKYQFEQYNEKERQKQQSNKLLEPQHPKNNINNNKVNSNIPKQYQYQKHISQQQQNFNFRHKSQIPSNKNIQPTTQQTNHPKVQYNQKYQHPVQPQKITNNTRKVIIPANGYNSKQQPNHQNPTINNPTRIPEVKQNKYNNNSNIKNIEPTFPSQQQRKPRNFQKQNKPSVDHIYNHHLPEYVDEHYENHYQPHRNQPETHGLSEEHDLELQKAIMESMGRKFQLPPGLEGVDLNESFERDLANQHAYEDVRKRYK